jgi:hypothetical protein
MSEAVGGTIANATKDFSVLVNSTNNVVTGVAVSGSTVTLTVTDVIPNSATVTWQYAQDADELITGTASASNAANSLLSVTTNQAVTLTNDTSPPTVVGVTSTSSDQVYGVGSAIPILVTFNEDVVVTGVPTLALETGTTDATVNYDATATAAYASSAGHNKSMIFTYTVANTHTTTDLAYKATTSLVTPSGVTIRDNLLTDATLTLASPGASGSLNHAETLYIDGVRPAASSTAATAGTKTIVITMSEAVGGTIANGTTF